MSTTESKEANQSMDILSDILNHLNLSTSLYFRTDLTGPWGVLVPNYKNVARFHITLKGSFWLTVEGQESLKVEPGDVVLVPHGAAHALTDDPQSELLELEDLIERSEYRPGELLRFGSGPGPNVQLVCGHFQFEEESLHPLPKALPHAIHVKKGSLTYFSWLSTALDFIDYESGHREPGVSSVINKLSEIILIQSLRYYMKTNSTNTLFLSALNDKYIRESIEQIHASPARNWKLEDLARTAGLSRTIYAERFSKLTGTTPMNYVTQWRMERARKLLKSPTISVDEVADRVGYSASESFQRRFKKCVGMTPSAYRKHHLQTRS